MQELYILNKSLYYNLYILILLESKSYILIPHTFYLYMVLLGGVCSNLASYKSFDKNYIFVTIYIIMLK